MKCFTAAFTLVMLLPAAASVLPAVDCLPGTRTVRAVDGATGEPLAGVDLQVHSGGPRPELVLAGRTGRDGRSCVVLAAGQLLIARRLGYAPIAVPIPVAAVELEVKLHPVAVELQPLVQRADIAAPHSVESSFGGAAHALTHATRRAVPALAGPDAVRMLSVVAPVAARSEFAPGLSIYGSSPDQTRLELEGIPLLSAQHLGGVFPALPEAALGAVSPAPATASAGAGGSLGGRVRMELRIDTTPGVQADVDVGLLATGGVARLTSSGGRMAATVSARISTVDRIAAQLHDAGFPYRFHDGLGALRLATPGAGTLTMLAAVNQDVLRLGSLPREVVGQRPIFTPEGGEKAASLERPISVDARWTTRAIGLRLVQPLGRFHLDARASRASSSGALGLSDGALRVGNDVVLTAMSGAVSLPLATSRGDVRAEAGVSATSANVDYELALLTVTVPEDRRAVASQVAWGEVEWPLTGTMRVRLGARHEQVPRARWSSVLPLVGVRWHAARRPLQLHVTAGRAAQWLHSATPDGFLAAPVELWLPSGASVPVAIGEELVVAGLAGDEAEGPMLRITGWIRHARQLPARPPALMPFGVDYLVGTVDARARGLDLRVVARRSRSAQLILGYTLASSTRSDSLATRPALDDRRHAVQALATFRPRAATMVSAAWSWHTGLPTTEQLGAYYARQPDALSGGWILGDVQPAYGTYHGMRLPNYARLDVQVTRTIQRTGNRVDVTVGVLNLLNRHNPLQYEWRYLEPPARRALRGQMPILPIVGVHGRF